MDLRNSKEDPDDPILGDLLHELEPKIGAQLPTNGDVLRYYLHISRTLHYKTKREKIALVLEKIAEFWIWAGIKTQDIKKSKPPTKKVEKLLQDYHYFFKNRDTFSDERETAFDSNNEKLFDISAKDAEDAIKKDRFRSEAAKKEDLNFLLDQKTERKCYLGKADSNYTKRKEQNFERKRRVEELNERYRNLEEQNRQVVHDNTDIEDAENNLKPKAGCSKDEDFIPPNKKRSKQQTKKRNILQQSKITEMGDRFNMSIRQRTGFAAAVAANCSKNLETLSLSKSTFHRCSKQNRTTASAEIRNDFIPPQHSILHWDGKRINENSKSGSTERLAIILSGHPTAKAGKILSIPAIKGSTGQSQATAAYTSCEDWTVVETVRGILFDTTASNTGWLQGACRIVEELFKRKLLWLACRHHLYERLLAAVYLIIFGPTTGPENKYFREFQNNWPNLNLKRPHKVYKTDNRKIKTVIGNVKSQLTATLSKDSGYFIRDDYKQCAQVILQVLDEVSDCDKKWHKPGAFHHARWMSSILYIPKMYAFSDQMGYTEEFVKKLEKFFIFTIFYIVPWLNTPNAADAPFNDLEFYKHIHLYGEEVDKKVAERALNIFQGQFWYLTEELVVFSLFSSKVSREDKKIMANTILKYQRRSTVQSLGKPVFPLAKKTTKLMSLVGPKSFLLFNLLGSDGQWLSKPVDEWKNYDDFNDVSIFVNNMLVVNDTAERGVKLIEDYANSITNDEQAKQDVLQIVESNRKLLPKIDKKSLTSFL